jgi:hypothetical protein
VNANLVNLVVEEFALKMKSFYFKSWIFVLVSLLLIPFIQAESGCFLYPESVFYCTDLDFNKANEECVLAGDCQLQEVYFSNQNCQDANQFPHCQKVFCKSSCTEEYLGKCNAGAVPDNGEAEWCSAGCCQFNSYAGDYCGYKKNKWLCEIDAKNKDTTQFSFDNPLTQQQCLQKCSQLSGLDPTVELEEVSEPIILPALLSEVNPITDSSAIVENDDVQTISQTNQQKVELPQLDLSIGKVWMLFVIFGIIGFIIYIHFKQKSFASLKKKTESPVSKKTNTEDYSEFKIHPELYSWGNFFSTNPEKKNIIKKIKEKRKHKSKERKRQDFFTEFGLDYPNLKPNEFEKLKKLIIKQKFRKKTLPKEEIKALEKLEKLIRPIKKNQGKEKQSPEQVNKVSEKDRKRAEEIKNVISKLKKIVKKS